MQTPTMPGHAYFVKQFLSQGLVPSEAPAKKHNGWQRRNIAASFLISVVVLTLIFHGKKVLHENHGNPVTQVTVSKPPVVITKPETNKDYDSFAMETIKN
jgi:hypothetical protein